MDKGAAAVLLIALLSLTALVASDGAQGLGDIIYDADDDLDLPEPGQLKEVGRERRQTWMGSSIQHANCRLEPSPGSTVQGSLFLFQKRWRWDYVKVKGSLWGMMEPKERFEVFFHEKAPPSEGDCDATGDTLFGSKGYEGYLGQVKAKGYGRATGFSRGSRVVTLESDRPNSIVGRSIVVTSLATRKRVACCTIQGE
ncbi:uncharacterized protein [Hetaerina americana]|uniref:uncharacterized protein n=1 Tax=Hetaerina americana TaxID=62018 RepID=UPI003A7F48A8